MEYEEMSELYEYQHKIKEEGKEKKEYEKYMQWMNQFYSKDSQYIKKQRDGKLILALKSNPSKEIVIEPAEFVNIHTFIHELKQKMDEIYQALWNTIETLHPTEETQEKFETLQEEYKKCKSQIEGIDSFQSLFTHQLLESFQIRMEKSFQLSKYYQRRKTAYASIEAKTDESTKKKIISLFQENKCTLPPQSKINQFSKRHNIPSKETEKWLEWIEQTYLYLKIQKEIHELSRQMIEKEKEYNEMMNSFLIQKPVVIL